MYMITENFEGLANKVENIITEYEDITIWDLLSNLGLTEEEWQAYKNGKEFTKSQILSIAKFLNYPDFIMKSLWSGDDVLDITKYRFSKDDKWYFTIAEEKGEVITLIFSMSMDYIWNMLKVCRNWFRASKDHMIYYTDDIEDVDSLTEITNFLPEFYRDFYDYEFIVQLYFTFRGLEGKIIDAQDKVNWEKFSDICEINTLAEEIILYMTYLVSTEILLPKYLDKWGIDSCDLAEMFFEELGLEDDNFEDVRLMYQDNYINDDETSRFHVKNWFKSIKRKD